ncbi:hypothetical protein ELH77_18970 [Rhizobium ruizarguesonis]|uniref:hypothetical protein n=1 Tax=Rhizobium ruizarguesonis TaxID=2081791 RepID=UPI001031AB75|nr:hypothetical protein [Rhizobium ruizarguesonis]TAZ20689.1 hypothetical protein ELH77_18970 [Rhizobium ruizarguesonis]
MIDRLFTDMPARIERLPRDARGFPIPKFVHTRDGLPDFRLVKPGWVSDCYRRKLCWLCGDTMGRHKSFVIGPMCCINRVSSEPPSHYTCARFAAKNCPFLTQPMAKRNERDLPKDRHVAGQMIDRNPGVCAIWTTDSYHRMDVHNGVLFQIGDPTEVEFYAKARRATREEVDVSIATGFPLLEKAAELDGSAGLKELNKMRRDFEKILDAKVPA